MRTSPSFSNEQQYWDQAITSIAGIDEVGMGALAGPVVAAAVVFSDAISLDPKIAIRDSKTLSALQREKANTWIQKHALSWAIGEASVAEITELNIRSAAHLAMRRAVDDLDSVPDLLLIDGTPAQIHPSIPAINIISGDSSSLSIAAASIVAKVYRDAMMVRLDKAFPTYGFASHKGYGARKHLDALQEHGACEHHRASYAPVAKVMNA